MKHLQPTQYASWLKKAHDPEWTEHRYRTGRDRAMVAAILDLEESQKALTAALYYLKHQKDGICLSGKCGQCEVWEQAEQALGIKP